MKVGLYYKYPIYPIWIVGSASHYTVMFGLDPNLNERSEEEKLEMKAGRGFGSLDPVIIHHCYCYCYYCCCCYCYCYCHCYCHCYCYCYCYCYRYYYCYYGNFNLPNNNPFFVIDSFATAGRQRNSSTG